MAADADTDAGNSDAQPRPTSAPPSPTPSRVWATRFLGQVVDVRPHELGGLLWSFSFFFFLLASYYVLRPLRDEMAIIGGVNRMQWLFTATLGVMLLVVPAWSALAARLPPRRLIAVVYRFFLANLALFFVLFHRFGGGHVPTARAFFVWTSVFSLFVVSVFWSFMADVFRQEQGKRLFGFVAAGGSAGAIVGPLLTSLIVDRIGPVNLLLIAGAFLEVAAQCAARLANWSSRRNVVIAAAATTGPDAPAPAGKTEVATTAVGGSAWAALRLLATSRYLGAIAGYVLLMTVTATFGYMLQARMVAAEGLTSAGRTGLFARIDLMVNLASAGTQAVLAGRVMARFGLTPALTLTPLLTIVASVALAAFPRLGVLIASNVTRRVAEYAVASPARQVLFTVVTREEKYKPKALIDTVIYRGGDVVGSWAFTAVIGLGASVSGVALCVIPPAIAWLAGARWLARRHERSAQRG
ncbi:MAG: MFS transporter [Pseudomonadota bacterium]